MAQQVSTNTFGVAKWIVDATASNGTHTTIATALTSASSGDTIFIRPGTYTEDLTLKVGVNLAAFDCDALTPNVTIVGKATLTTAGTVSISGIRLQTNSDFLLAVTGSVASIVNLQNCYINCLNNTSISYTSSSSSSRINLFNCIGNIGTTGITYIVSTGAGQVTFNRCKLANTGAATTASSTSACTINFLQCEMNFALSTSSSGAIGIYNTIQDCTGINTTGVTLAGTGSCAIENSSVKSGTASAISIGTGTTGNIYNVEISSSNTNAITGAGTLNYASVTFSGSSSTMNTTTQAGFTTRPGITRSAHQPAFTAYLSTNASNVTGDGTQYTVIFDTAITNQGNNYNVSNGIFTAPVTGLYQFTSTIFWNNVEGSAATGMIVAFAGSRYSYRGTQFNELTSTSTTPNCQTISGLIQMTASDTMSISVFVTGTTKSIGLNGAAPTAGYATTCIFSGYLVC